MESIAVALIGYAVGCFVTAYYLVRWRSGADIRDAGSGNAGARNVLRTRGRADAVATVLGDAGKCALAVLVAERLGAAPWAGGLAFLAVVAGHVWPAQLGFRGGKGAAPALGGWLVVSPAATGVGVGVLIVSLALTRRVTVSGLLGIAAAPVAYAFLGGAGAGAALTALASTLVLAAHHPAFPRPRVAERRPA